MKYEAIVVGGGVQGLWTANHLAIQKCNVLLLEQFPFPHTRGSSHGLSRITRYSYATFHHTQMMVDAFKMWDNLENRQKLQLFVNCGLLSVGPDECINAIGDHLNVIKNDFERMSSEEVTQKFVGLSSNFNAIYERSAGLLKANKCLEALYKNLLSLGGNMLDERKVELIKPISDELVEVVTNNGTYFSKSVVLTCGPWINKVLKPLNLQLPIKPLKISVEYWKAKTPNLYHAKNFPAVIIDDPSSSEHVYSLPILEYPDLMKVCCHGGTEASPDDLSRYDRASEESKREVLKDVVSRFYSNLVPECALQETCFYSVTPDNDFILDRHPRFKNVVVGAGFSGHGFKLSPVVGKILADLAIGEKSKYDISYFSMKRFNSLKSSL